MALLSSAAGVAVAHRPDHHASRRLAGGAKQAASPATTTTSAPAPLTARIEPSSTPVTSPRSPTTSAPQPVQHRGDLVLSAAEEPDCMDWIGACALSSWGIYTVQANTMPRAFDYTDSGYQPSPLLAGEPVLQASPRQVVTYHINPQAVWSDGHPIVSHDFSYTWDQIAHGQNIADTTGYSQITSVDDRDPHRAVVTFSSPFPDWKMLFGGFDGLLPSHLLGGQDRDAAMKDGYSWSGGPWKLDHWSKGTEVVLVPNPNYWGKKPKLSSVTFRFVTDAGAEAKAFASGQVLAVYPQAQPNAGDLKGRPGTFFDAVGGLSYEALWFNVEKAPLNDVKVRQALAYATDRDAIAASVFGSIQPGVKAIQSFFTPAFGPAYSDPFSRYQPSLSQVNQLMAAAGYAKGPDGVWAKGGHELSIELKTTAT